MMECFAAWTPKPQIKEIEQMDQKEKTDKEVGGGQAEAEAAGAVPEPDKEPEKAEAEVKKEEPKPDPKDAEIAKLKDENKRLKDDAARARADYFNLRNRVVRDREMNAKLASEQAVRSMLPIFENLERIAAAVEDKNSSLAKGMSMVIKQFSAGLEGLGLEFINAEGKFDPKIHEAISMEPVDDESKDGHILGAVSRGYKLAGRVLKAPQVRVGKYQG